MKVRSRGSFETKMDMTPLIDCVFLLIMFFILTTQITVELEEVTLPFALEGKKPPPEGDLTVILNVRLAKNAPPEERAGEIVYKGQAYTDVKALTKELKAEVFYDKTVRGREPERGPEGQELSQLEILIRADKDVRAEYLEKIFRACFNAGIYKIKLTSQQPSEG